MKKEILQNELDIKKWLESEQASRDLCGTYEFCKGCNKEKEFPCAMAYNKFKRKPAKPIPFCEKLAACKDETKAKYALLCDEFKAAGIKISECKYYTTFKKKNKVIAKASLIKNSLKLHLAIDPNTHEEIKHLDYSLKKLYASTPFTVRLTSKKIIKASVKLIKK